MILAAATVSQTKPPIISLCGTIMRNRSYNAQVEAV